MTSNLLAPQRTRGAKNLLQSNIQIAHRQKQWHFPSDSVSSSAFERIAATILTLRKSFYRRLAMLKLAATLEKSHLWH
ncbi:MULTISPECIES: hypothetical protein [Cyanophyceae]|uniref:hypothetical protein n=1 Tax=Cyanophyceae TaxID=3028117 RepID=UPI0016870DB4|nr:hypothetical protein [Trichocoleus sp. FACHB-69]MBD1931396.1 hypothetical protein [Trichocoleus sp. FACHB-69]